MPATRIYVSNLYDIEGFPIPTEQLVGPFNQIVSGAAASINATVCGGRIKVVDAHSALAGSQQGQLLISRPGAAQFEPHPTNAGHAAIAQAFVDAK